MLAGSFAALGAAAGVSQALLLRRAAGTSPGAFGVLLRLMLVGAALFASALFGHLLAGACGWALGFAAGSIVAVRRLS